MELLLLAVPFITSGIMFLIKWIAGLALTNNGSDMKPWLRALLVAVSLGGYIAAQTLNGTPVDPNVVSQDVGMFLATGILAYFAHALYNSAFRRYLSPALDTQ